MAKQGIQWGTQRFQGNTQPNWHVDLTTDGTAGSRGYNANNVIYSRPNHSNAGENLEATDRGWERVVSYTDSSGQARTKREVVIAQGGLANTLAFGTADIGKDLANLAKVAGGPQIVDIRWSTANNDTGLVSGVGGGDGFLFPSTTAATPGVVVTYSEPVLMDETSAIATGVVLAKTGGSVPALKLTSGNGTNQLTFSGTGTAMAAGATVSFADSKTFIVVGSATLTALKSGTGFGRKSGALAANTPAASTHRTANVSSLGIVGLLGADDVQSDDLTLATNAGTRKVKD